MRFTPYSYTTSAEDISIIRALGYSFEGSPRPPHQFINDYFPNLDLVSALTAIDVPLSDTTNSALYRKIILDDGKPELEVQFFSANYRDANEGLALSRIFRLESSGPVVTHELLRLPAHFRKRGISKIILTAMFQQYVNVGVKKILVHAALADGGLVWAKQFFMAIDKTEVKAILDKARAALTPEQFRTVSVIFDHYYSQNPDGQAFPMYKWAELPFLEPILRGSHWHGAVDLTNPVELTNFVHHAIG